MKRLAILSNGPSVKRFDGSEQFDEVIGVRGVCELHDLDYWVGLDWQEYERRKPKMRGRPTIFCTIAMDERMRNLVSRDYARHGEMFRLWRAEEKLFVEDGPQPPLSEGVSRWTAYSGVTALLLAWRLSPAEVHVWGMDLGGDQDHCGESNPSYHSGRWGEERQQVAAMVEHLEAAGSTVRFRGEKENGHQHTDSRHGPDFHFASDGEGGSEGFSWADRPGNEAGSGPLQR